jgi:hypothetical protein
MLARAGKGHADIVAIPYHKLINSDVVVLAMLENTHRETYANREFNTGTIRVLQTFSGDAVAEQRVQIWWENEVGVGCRISHEHLIGREAIWFLTHPASAGYDANATQRAVPIARDVLSNFVEYFPKLHGRVDTRLEEIILAWVQDRLRHPVRP